MAKYYGQTWKDLSPSSKESIGFLVMGETSINMKSTGVRMNNTCRPEYWYSWASPLAQELTHKLTQPDAPGLAIKNITRRLDS